MNRSLQALLVDSKRDQTAEIGVTARVVRMAGVIAVAVAAILLSGFGGSRPPRFIFWTQSPHGGQDERGSIGRAELDGSRPNGAFAVGAKAFKTGEEYGVIGIVGVYFVYAIGRANLNGSQIEPRFVVASNVLDGIAVNGRYIF